MIATAPVGIPWGDWQFWVATALVLGVVGIVTMRALAGGRKSGQTRVDITVERGPRGRDGRGPT